MKSFLLSFFLLGQLILSSSSFADGEMRVNQISLIQKISDGPLIQKAIKIKSVKDMLNMKLPGINQFIVSLLTFHTAVENFELEFGKLAEKPLSNTILKTLIAKRILSLKKNELIHGHIIQWKHTEEWINDERKRILKGGRVRSAKKWSDSVNDPHGIFKNRDYQTKIFNLPLTGSLDIIPYSDDYWASYHGGLSYRWNSPDPKEMRYSYDYLTKEQVETMTLEEMKKLSPAEKYDIYTGSYKDKRRPFALTRSERKRTRVYKTIKTNKFFDPNFKIKSWMGLCHAWAPSTLMYKTPGAVTLKGKTGIMVPFGSSDIKALLTLNVHHNIVPYMPPMVGNACKEDFRKANMETIRMTNPALSEKEVKKTSRRTF